MCRCLCQQIGPILCSFWLIKILSIPILVYHIVLGVLTIPPLKASTFIFVVHNRRYQVDDAR